MLKILAATLVALAQEEKGFIPLFNGTNLDGWHAGIDRDPRITDEKRPEELGNHWRVENGELVNDGKGPFLTTDASFGDLELVLEWKISPKADSGVYLRGTPQVQIWDTTEEGGKWKNGADKGSGGLWNNPKGAPGRDPLVRADRPIGEWNAFRIVQLGCRISVWLNDQVVVDHALMENYWDKSVPIPARGPVKLQTHDGEVRWRNLKVREISPDEANALLAAHGGEGFVSVFNGRDFEGWDGALDGFEVRDGTLVCKPKMGGNLYTREEYSDFSVRLEIKFPPGGNNGLAIRYPGEGDPAYTGMCEVQTLDDTAEMYSKLDIRQYHGSVYGVVPAHRGYLRPVGEWNFQEVTVKGSTVRVELNGTVILDADIGKVTGYMGGREHPGKDRPSGHFGFAGHNDPVQYRAIRIKPLK